jgi:hypothetical protein
MMRFLGQLSFLLSLALAGLAPAMAGSQEPKILDLSLTACDARTAFLDLGKDAPAFQEESYSVTALEVPKPTVEAPEGQPRVLGSTTGQRIQPRELRALFERNVLPASTVIRFIVRDRAGKAIAVGDLATQGKGSIEHSKLEISPNRFEVTSVTPLARIDFDRRLTLVEIEQKAHFVRQAGGKEVEIPEKTRRHEASVTTPSRESQCQTKDGRIDSFSIQIAEGDKIRPESVALRLEGLTDVYGNTVKVESDITPPSAPKGKEDAKLYASISLESAADGPDSLSLDFKAQPSFEMAGDLLFRPELIVSVSKNTTPATNSIRLAALASYTAIVRPPTVHRGALVSSTISFGPSIEADRNFDRVNGILDLRWEPGLAGFFHSRVKEKTARAGRAQKLKDAPLPTVGWGLDGWIGLEAGKSLKQQTVANSANTATLTIHRYDVLRLRPFVHGFYENGSLTFDVSSTLRYLFTDELSYEEKADHTLALRKVKNARPYTEATLSWALDPVKHFNFALTYKNGSEPPLFVTVKKYSLGFVTKF